MDYPTWPFRGNSMTLISVSVPVLLCLFSALYLRAFGGPLGPIPGPLDARFSRLWMIKHSWQGDMHRTMIRLHKKYGSLVRTGPNEVSVIDLSAIKKIYAAGTKFSKSNWYGVWQGHRKFDLFAERDERIHSSQRRLVSPIYSTNALKDLEQYMDNAVAHFCQKMQDRLGQNVDMGLFVQLFAFDVVGEVTFSKRLGFMDAGSDNGFFAQIESMLRSAAWVGQIPTLYWIHDYLSPTIGNYLGVTARHGRLRDFASQEVENRKRVGSDHQDILAKLLEVQKQRPDEMNDTNILSMATTNVAAGSDTTAISIRSVIYHLLKNPECKRRLIEEIDSQMAKVGLPKAVVPLDQTKHMPYLQACLYEGLRLHPAVGMSLPRVTPPGGIWIDRHFIPEGAIIGTNPWVVHRNTEIFGDDVESFRPERWLKTDDRANMEKFFFAFGQGARLCLGRNLSWMEMSKLIPTLFSRFDIELTDPEAELKETCWWFVKQEGLFVTLRSRSKVQ